MHLHQPASSALAHHSSEARQGAHVAAQYTPLDAVTRTAVDTAAAAFYLNRRPQTLRIWAMGKGPIQPLRVHGRLAWRVADIKRLLGMGAQS